jgi:hypothetical protein
MILQQPPPLAAYQVNSQDESHLNIISICHYVMGGFYLLGIVFVIAHFMIMTMVFRMAEKEAIAQKQAIEAAAAAEAQAKAEASSADDSSSTEPKSPSELLGLPASASAAPTPSSPVAFPKEMISIFYIFYIVIGSLLVALCVCNALSGYYIRKRKNQIFSYIIAGLNCMHFPLGTTLGVFTFLVLTRTSVKMAYDANAPN